MKIKLSYILIAWAGNLIHSYILAGDYLIGDSAYPKSETQIVPFKRCPVLTKKEKTFNRHISKYRVKVEHTIGIMKGRFQSLLGLRVQVNKAAGHQKACRWVGGGAVLHNILISIDNWNQPTDYIHFEPEDDAEPCEAFATSGIRTAADIIRQVLVEITNSMY